MLPKYLTILLPLLILTSCSGGEGGTDSETDGETDAGDAPAVDIVVNDDATCLLPGDGKVLCWGQHPISLGLGVEYKDTHDLEECPWMPENNPPSCVSEPTELAVSDVVDVVSNDLSSCARTETGDVYCWGEFDGADGVSGNINYLEPTLVPELADAEALSVSGSLRCKLDSGGAVTCSGFNLRGQVGTGFQSMVETWTRVEGLPPIQEIAVERERVCALDTSGGVWCWGDNRAGQAGVAAEESDLCVADHACVVQPALVAGLENVIGLDVSDSHSCALRDDGVVLCWGDNTFGQLGNSTFESTHIPTPVELLPVEAVSVHVANEYITRATSCVIGKDEKVYCWGNSSIASKGLSSDQLDPSCSCVPSPREIPGVDDVVRLSVGTIHACAVSGDADEQRALCWGVDGYLQLGCDSGLIECP